MIEQQQIEDIMIWTQRQDNLINNASLWVTYKGHQDIMDPPPPTETTDLFINKRIS